MPDQAHPESLLPPWLADVSVDFGAATRPAVPTASGLLWSADADSFALHVPGVADYVARAGERLTIEPAPDAGDDAISRHALMSPLAALCYQRGLVPLHAAAARRNDRTILIAGDSGAGKSTLLAALTQSGWEPLADELTALTVDAAGRPVAFPAAAEVRLWPDAARKFKQPASPSRTAEPSPVAAIWWLSVGSDPAVRADTIRGLEAVDAVGRLTYNASAALHLLDRQANLRVAAALAENVTVIRARRPRGWCIPDLCELVEHQATTTRRRRVAFASVVG